MKPFSNRAIFIGLYLIFTLPSLLFSKHGTAASAVSVQEDETRETFHNRMKKYFQDFLDSQNETSALWIGLSDPDYGDHLFVVGNASGGPPPPANQPATLDQRFDIGSISKSFGATVLMLLAQQNYLKLEDAVQQLLPEFASQFPQYGKYSVEELLRMKTLVPDYINDPTMALMNDFKLNLTKCYTVEELVAFVMPRYPEPKVGYSSTNFIVAELIAETVTNLSMPEIVESFVLRPLGIANHTTLPDRFSDGVHPEPSATPYSGPLCGIVKLFPNQFPGSPIYADLTELTRATVLTGIGGAMNTDIADLLEWAKSGTGDKLLSPEMVQRRHRFDNPIQNFGDYGIGQFVDQDGWYGHKGDAFGYTAYAFKNDNLNASFAGGVNTCNYYEGLEALKDKYTKELEARRSSSTTESSGLDANDGLQAEVSASSSATNYNACIFIGAFQSLLLLITFLI